MLNKGELLLMIAQDGFGAWLEEVEGAEGVGGGVGGLGGGGGGGGRCHSNRSGSYNRCSRSSARARAGHRKVGKGSRVPLLVLLEGDTNWIAASYLCTITHKLSSHHSPICTLEINRGLVCLNLSEAVTGIKRLAGLKLPLGYNTRGHSWGQSRHLNDGVVRVGGEEVRLRTS